MRVQVCDGSSFPALSAVHVNVAGRTSSHKYREKHTR
ncbi:hypothetical protein DRQ25_10830 [Candidatus Fermentibacteria bacterium]|nr:MAG: hypothetical protein DRQ25_10830 [Candidatus Fermentibacteria bacterium]